MKSFARRRYLIDSSRKACGGDDPVSFWANVLNMKCEH